MGFLVDSGGVTYLNNMKTIHQKLNDVELDIQNLSTFIAQCMEKLKCKLCQYQRLQRDLYVQDGLEKLNNYANKGSSLIG